MSIQFVLGPAGSGKSKYLQKTLIEMEQSKSGRKLLLIVPDQYNMQTQRSVILAHPDRAFSNIEVLSFSRLSHRILEEVGGEDIPVLDDTGKSLIIRHVAFDVEKDLKMLNSKMSRIGFVHEVKSAISEFMQYGISPDEVHNLSLAANNRKSLQTKLNDLEIIYRAFKQYKSDHFITREETLELVKTSLHKSELVKDSIIIFDGFTGFTPIQERVIQELMIQAKKIIFSFTYDGKDPYKRGEEQELFYLSIRTVNRLKALADEASVMEEAPLFFERKKEYGKDPELFHLEQNLFRYPFVQYKEKPEHIRVYKATNIKSEIIDTCARIVELTKHKGYKYRDIAIVVGNMETYADEIQEIAAEFELPIYMDYSRSVMLSPFIEYLRSAFDVIESDYSYESVMRHLRLGMSDISMEECDVLENFLLKTGIRGQKSYNRVWTVRYNKNVPESDEHRDKRLAKMEQLNNIRERVVVHFSGLHNTTKTVREHSTEVFNFLEKSGVYDMLYDRAVMLSESGDESRASEYYQIYDKVIELLDQIVALTGDETETFKEYREILEAGFGEIKLGVIPQQVDTITVNDFIRSRLSDIKVLFVLGVNDCNVPGGISSGGIISDLDREFIKSSTDTELAPTPREQMFTQRLYLYMNMTKPSDELFISYPLMDESGNSLNPSYLINTLTKLYSELKVLDSEDTHTCNDRIMPAGKHLIKMEVAGLLRDFAISDLSEKDKEAMSTLILQMKEHGELEQYNDISKASFEHFKSTSLSRDIAKNLYGSRINASVSRMERFAACAYAHFLTYGMSIRKRSEFGFERRDMGEIFHLVLEQFSQKAKHDKRAWDSYSSEDISRFVDDALLEITNTYGETILLSTYRTQALSNRLSRILKRTIEVLSYQIAQGDFVPDRFEETFREKRKISVDNDYQLDMYINGKIDRLDICEQENGKYIRIVDYKSGNKSFDINALFHGLSLQLPIYMKQAVKLIPEAAPVGMLYYHIDDPVIKEEDAGDTYEQIEGQRLKELKLKGLVSTDIEKLCAMDRKLSAGSSVSSDIISASIKKDGSLKNSNSNVSDEELNMILDFADKKLEELAAQIGKGVIDVKPCAMDEEYTPCKYCDFKSICRIDSGAPGYELNILSKESSDEVFEKIRQSLDEE